MGAVRSAVTLPRFAKIQDRIGRLKMPHRKGIGVVGPGSTELQFLRPPWRQRNGATYVGPHPVYKRADSLQHLIYGDSHHECPGLVIINRQQGWHHYVHFYLSITAVELHKHLVNEVTFDGSDVYVLPGCQLYTRGVMGQLLLGLALVEPTLLDRVQFVHFPKADPWIRGARKLVSFGGRVGYFDKHLRWKSKRTSPIEVEHIRTGWCDDIAMREAGDPRRKCIDRMLTDFAR